MSAYLSHAHPCHPKITLSIPVLCPRSCHSEPNSAEGGSSSCTNERKGETGSRFTRACCNLLISCLYKPGPLSSMLWKRSRWWRFSEGLHLHTETSKHQDEWKKGSRGCVSWPAQRPMRGHRRKTRQWDMSNRPPKSKHIGGNSLTITLKRMAEASFKGIPGY